MANRHLLFVLFIKKLTKLLRRVLERTDAARKDHLAAPHDEARRLLGGLAGHGERVPRARRAHPLEMAAATLGARGASTGVAQS